jgi:hypothetical protein
LNQHQQALQTRASPFGHILKKVAARRTGIEPVVSRFGGGRSTDGTAGAFAADGRNA